jgi:hypothetical protein
MRATARHAKNIENNPMQSSLRQRSREHAPDDRAPGRRLEGWPGAQWFETALKQRLLTMRVQDLILRDAQLCGACQDEV